jgi:oligopeptidase A
MNFDENHNIDTSTWIDRYNQTLDYVESEIKKLECISNPTWDNFIKPIDILNNILMSKLGFYDYLKKTHIDSNDTLSEIENLAYEFDIKFYRNEKLFQIFQNYSKSKEFKTLKDGEKLFINSTLEYFNLQIGFTEEEADLHLAINEDMSILFDGFMSNIMKSTKKEYIQLTQKRQLDGLCDSFIDTLRNNAIAKNKSGWIVLNSESNVYEILGTSNNRSLRRKAFLMKVHTSDPNGFVLSHSNDKIIEKIIKSRIKMTSFLKEDSFAIHKNKYSMNKDPDKILKDLHDLADKFSITSNINFQKISIFAESHLGLTEIEEWDLDWVIEKYKELTYGIVDINFYLDEAKSGCFEFIEKFYDVEIVQDKSKKLHKDDIELYLVYNKAGVKLGSFYLDLLENLNKEPGAWCTDTQHYNIHKKNDKICHVVCDFIDTKDNGKHVISYDEMEVLFHEMGHCMHVLLSQVNIPSISGFNVEIDASEIPSQLFEKVISHYDIILPMYNISLNNDKILTKTRFNNFLKAQKFTASSSWLNTIIQSIFDIYIHHHHVDKYSEMILFYKDLNKKYFKEIPHKYKHTAINTLEHIFGADNMYEAQYHSYVFSDLYSCALYNRIFNKGYIDYDFGKIYLKHNISKGNTEHSSDMLDKLLPDVDSTLSFVNYYT